MQNLTLEISKMAPSKGITPEVIKDQFNWRKSLKFNSKTNYITIIDIEEPVWWNRPLTSDTLIKLETDGLWSYNLPYIGNHPDFKTGYNLLLSKNSIAISLHIRLNPRWTPTQTNSLKDSLSDIVYQSLIELGVKEEFLACPKNDMLYKGKKFLGHEQKIANGVLSQDAVLTLYYTPEKDLFERLTGKYALSRGITGIIEETNCFTKEQLISTIYNKFKLFTDTLE